MRRRSSDPQGEAQTLEQWAERRLRGACCSDLANACDKCWLPLLARSVAGELLAILGPTISESDPHRGILEDSGALPQTAVRPREPTADEAAATAVKPKGKRRSTAQKSREQMLAEVAAFVAKHKGAKK